MREFGFTFRQAIGAYPTPEEHQRWVHVSGPEAHASEGRAPAAETTLFRAEASEFAQHSRSLTRISRGFGDIDHRAEIESAYRSVAMSEYGPAATRQYSYVSVSQRILLGQRKIVLSAGRAGSDGLAGISESDIVEAAAALRERVGAVTPSPVEFRHDGPVVFSAAAAATLIHEVLGHGLEADNFERFNLAQYYLRYAVPFDLLELGGGPNVGGMRGVDDEGHAIVTEPLVVQGRLVGLVSAGRWTTADYAPVYRGRRENAYHPIIPRVNSLEWIPSQDLVATTPRDGSAQVHDIELASVNLREGRVHISVAEATLPNGQAVLGGRIELNIGDFFDNVAAAGDVPEMSWMMCRKQGQRVPSSVTTPWIAVDNLRLESGD